MEEIERRNLAATACRMRIYFKVSE